MDGFESWTRQEIGRLRSEADALERTLERFLASRPKAAPADASGPSSKSDKKTHPRKRRSKNDPIRDVINRAGPNGLSLDEIFAAAEAAGITSTRDAIRSFCWNEKQIGRFIQPAEGRYASAPGDKDEAAGTTDQDDPAASETHNYAGSARGGGT